MRYLTFKIVNKPTKLVFSLVGLLVGMVEPFSIFKKVLPFFLYPYYRFNKPICQVHFNYFVNIIKPSSNLSTDGGFIML
jgi:hypothetical protein